MQRYKFFGKKYIWDENKPRTKKPPVWYRVKSNVDFLASNTLMLRRRKAFVLFSSVHIIFPFFFHFTVSFFIINFESLFNDSCLSYTKVIVMSTKRTLGHALMF